KNLHTFTSQKKPMPVFKIQITLSLMFQDSLMASALFKKHALRLGRLNRAAARPKGMNDGRRNSWCRGYYRNPTAAAAPLSVSSDRPRHRHPRRGSWHRHQEPDDERGALCRALS